MNEYNVMLPDRKNTMAGFLNGKKKRKKENIMNFKISNSTSRWTCTVQLNVNKHLLKS